MSYLRGRCGNCDASEYIASVERLWGRGDRATYRVPLQFSMARDPSSSTTPLATALGSGNGSPRRS